MTNYLKQNHIEHLTDMVQQRKMTPDEANVQQVLIARVKIIDRSLPKAVRMALNQAVRDGRLCRKPKTQDDPEVYYHPNFEYLVSQELRERKLATMRALAGIVSRPFEHEMGQGND